MTAITHNIDNADDDEYFAVTEGLAVAGQAMAERGARTALSISLDLEGGADAVLAGYIDEQVIERFEQLLGELKAHAAESTEPVQVLHVTVAN